MELLRDAGIECFSLDLIMGSPGSSFDDWAHDLDQALALEPGHLSCYGLQYEPNTPLAAKLARVPLLAAPLLPGGAAGAGAPLADSSASRP